MCWYFNVRDHTLTTESIVPMHWYPVTGAVREFNHFPYIQVYVLIHRYRQTFQGGLQLSSHIINLINFYYVRTFKLLGLNFINANPN
jgi:hypothetical protein